MFQVQVHSHILEMWAFTVSSVGEGVEHFDVQERAGNGMSTVPPPIQALRKVG